MSRAFEELDRRQTVMGEISLRRRLEPSLRIDVFEVKLGEEFLMSSLFTTGEQALARLGLGAIGRDPLDVVVGGLGLGYTAMTALEDQRVRRLCVVEALEPVIDWARRGLGPLGMALINDQRCEIVHADFFALVADGRRFGRRGPALVDAVLVDIDHTPRHLLHPSHGALYQPSGLRRLLERLRPGGVFGLWSDDPPDSAFVARLSSVFAQADAHVVRFPNFYTGGHSTSTIYVAVAP